MTSGRHLVAPGRAGVRRLAPLSVALWSATGGPPARPVWRHGPARRPAGLFVLLRKERDRSSQSVGPLGPEPGRTPVLSGLNELARQAAVRSVSALPAPAHSLGREPKHNSNPSKGYINPLIGRRGSLAGFIDTLLCRVKQAVKLARQSQLRSETLQSLSEKFYFNPSTKFSLQK